MKNTNREATTDRDSQSGVKAVETAAGLLVAMRDGPGRETLKDIADRAGMYPAKAHRYLVSLIRVGIVTREESTGLYAWGPLAIDIGAAAIGASNLVRTGAEEVIRLRDTLQVSVALALWGTFGPTHVYVEEANRAVITKSQVGSVLPIFSSATGRAFAAFDRSPAVEEMLELEITELASSSADQRRLRQEFEVVREASRAAGLGQSLGDFTAGIISLSGPVFDYRGRMVGAITILSHQGDFDPSLDGPAAAEVRASGVRLSRKLGYLPPAAPADEELRGAPAGP